MFRQAVLFLGNLKVTITRLIFLSIALITLFLSGSGLVFGQTSSGQTLEGTLSNISVDGAPGSNLESFSIDYLVDSKGNQTQLILDEKLVLAAGGRRALMNKIVKVSGTTTNTPQAIAGASSTALKVDSLSVVGVNAAQPAVEPNLAGSQAYINILCKFPDVANLPEQPTYFPNLMNDANYGMNKYWLEASYNNINLNGSSSVTQWYNLPHNKSYYFTNGSPNLSVLSNDCGNAPAASVNVNGYTGINLIFNDVMTLNGTGGYSVGGWGQPITIQGVYRGWQVTWMAPWGYGPYPGYKGGPSGLAHEMGHTFGLPHSTGPGGPTLKTPGDNVYKNNWDVMSNAWNYCVTVPTYNCLGYHMNAWDKDHLGWIPANRKYTYPGSGQVSLTLERLAQPNSNPNYLMVVIPINGSSSHYYTVEARSKIGFDNNLGTNAVIIYDVDTTRQWSDGYAWLVSSDTLGDLTAAWTVGKPFSDSTNNITVRVDTANTSSFDITINPTQAPIPPTNLTTSAASTNQINLSWTNNAGNNTGFIIKRGTDGVNFPDTFNMAIGVTSYSDTTVSDGTKYYYQVQATKGGLTSTFSNIANATTPLIAPTNLQSQTITQTIASMNWSDNTLKETNYVVERGTDGTNFPVTSTVATGLASFSATGLFTNTTYYFRVKAINAITQSGYSNVISLTTLPDPISSPPTLNSLSVFSSVQINLSWNDVTGETYYTVQRSTTGATGPWTSVATVPANTIAYSDKSLAPNSTYFYQVIAGNRAGIVTSNAQSAKTKSVAYTVSNSSDSGQDIDGTLTHALLHAVSGDTIDFTVASVTVDNNQLPDAKTGVAIYGGACGGTRVKINAGTGLSDTTYGLKLTGGNVVVNLSISGFPANQIVAVGGSGTNNLQCTKTSKALIP